MTKRATQFFIIGTFVTLYLLVSIISTIHVIDFFSMSNPEWLAISLAIAFEVGAAASLASIITLDKMNKGIVWGLFILLTLMQAMGNTYYTYVHLKDFNGWVELFGLVEEELIYQKRVLSIVSGAILPIVALGFIKSLVDYIKPAADPVNDTVNDTVNNIVIEPVLTEPSPIKEEKIPYVSDDFQIGPDGAYEHSEESELIKPVIEEPTETTTQAKVDNKEAKMKRLDEDLARGRTSGLGVRFTDKL